MIEMSEKIDELAKALVQCQAKLKPAKKDSENPFFKSRYADLMSVFKAIQGPLTENGLAISQFPTEGGLTTILMHESGQWIRGFSPMPSKDNSPQSVGSSITYARRYGLMSVVGLPADDDDGNAAETGVKTRYPQDDMSKKREYRKDYGDYDPTKDERQVTEAQLKRLFALKNKAGWTDKDAKDVVAAMGYESSKDMKRNDYQSLCECLEANNTAAEVIDQLETFRSQ